MHSFIYIVTKNTKKMITKTHLLMIKYHVVVFLHIMHS